MAPSDKKIFAYRIVIYSALATLIVGMYFTSGNLATYAVSARDMLNTSSVCMTIENPDYGHHFAVHRMVDGVAPHAWSWSVVLRRVLMHIIAYPATKIWGYFFGTIFTSFMLQIIAFLGFVYFIQCRFGYYAAAVIAMLLATYPGTTYWWGQPYCYAIIVPGMLASIACIWSLAERPPPKANTTLSLALFLGIVFTGYDLLPYFGFTAITLIALTRRWRLTAASLALMILPQVAVHLFIKWRTGMGSINGNTMTYVEFWQRLNRPMNGEAWVNYISNDLPGVAAKVFVGSNFWFLPLGFLLAMILGHAAKKKTKAHIAELLLYGIVLLSFLYHNLIPFPAEGADYELRGTWIARFYQGVIGAYLLYFARWTHNTAMDAPGWFRVVPGLLALVISIANFSVVIGPKLDLKYSYAIIYDFYDHCAGRECMQNNLNRIGRTTLLGSCPPRT